MSSSQTNGNMANDCQPEPVVVTPHDVVRIWLIPLSSQKKQRDLGTFARHYRVGKRVYYRRAAVEQWVLDQENASAGVHRGR
jgi:hypothetical protein